MALSVLRIGSAVALSVCALSFSDSLLQSTAADSPPRGDSAATPVTAGPDFDATPSGSHAVQAYDAPSTREKQRLRVLFLADNITPEERRLLEQFSHDQELSTEWNPVSSPWEMLAALKQGRADIAASLTDSLHPGPGMPVQGTLSWGVTQPRVVGRDGSGVIDELQDLSVRQVAVREKSTGRAMIFDLQRNAPAMDVIAIPASLSDRQVLERVRSGQYDLAVLNSRALQSLLADFPGLEVQLALGEPVHRRWLVRADAERLLGNLNRFINRKQLEMELARIYRQDLSGLKKRKLLRLITVRSPVNVYFDNGRLRGFEYELIKRFAGEHGMRVDVVLARDLEEMRVMLNQGRGDVIAASLPRDSLEEDGGLRVSRAYHRTAPVLVGRPGDGTIQNPQDLHGRRIYLPAESPWRGYLESLRSEYGINLELPEAEAGLDTETVLFRVGRGLYDLTVIGSHEVKAELSRQLNLKLHMRLSEPQPQVWAVRGSDTQLLSALNEFIGREYRRGFYNVIQSRYIERPPARKASADQLAELRQLSPFDRIVHRYAEEYGFDWRLVVAQMYQESRFDPAAVSYAGAEGLMQLLPETAAEMGVDEWNDPVHNIRGGIRYLGYLRGRFDDVPQLQDRTWFTLAAYNAGYRRIRQARRLAEQMDLNPNRWFDHVEMAMLVLARPYHRDGEWTRRCRCGQTVAYVREIRTLYNNYVRLTEAVRSADARESRGEPLAN